MASLKTLPDIAFAERDASVIQTSIIQSFEALIGSTLAAGDPRRLFLLTLAAIIIQQRAIIDQSAKMNLLAYATGSFLDHIGLLVGCERIKAAAAMTTLTYTLSAERIQATIIPKGSRVTAGDNIYFATDEDLAIPAGSMTGTVGASCLMTGAVGNGYAIGELTMIVDPVPFVASVANITVSSGGAEDESDDAYRSRIQEAPESFSCAGSEGAYVYWAKTASALIADVAVISPEPCYVNVYPLLEGGELPSEEIIEAVDAVLNKRTVRPLTDFVTVAPPVVKEYDIALSYYIDTEDSTNAASIQAAVDKAIEKYILWQKSKLGRDINPTELYYRIRAAGAKRAEIISPSFMAIKKHEVAIGHVTNIIFGGLEDG